MLLSLERCALWQMLLSLERMRPSEDDAEIDGLVVAPAAVDL